MMMKPGLDALVGRDQEAALVRACIRSKRNVLLEGPVGVGKTRLALSLTAELGVPWFRVDGDSRYSEQKLAGWFDPPTVVKRGYLPDAFFPGPLVEAMNHGGVLFINELNRLPEGVQNILLPAIDEGMILVPRMGEIKAKDGFLVVATQNPKEFVATSHLSEAILDRFELVSLDYQTESEEIAIVENRLKGIGSREPSLLALVAVRIARKTRGHPRVRRGASIRAALSIAEISNSILISSIELREAVLSAALVALPTRVEIEREIVSGQTLKGEIGDLIREWTRSAFDDFDSGEGIKKKN